MMGLEWEFVPGLGRIAAYLRICVSAYLYAGGGEDAKKTRGFDRAFCCLETD